MAEDIPRAAPPRTVAWHREPRRDWRDPSQHDESGQDSGARGEDGRRALFARAAGLYERFAAESPNPDDTIAVQGVPPSHLTPPVRRALGRLMSEVERLRLELAGHRGDSLVPPHPLDGIDDPTLGLQVLDTRPLLTDPAALERALRLRLEASGQGASAPAVVFLYMANFEDVRSRQGLAAADAAYHGMIEKLLAMRDPDEVMGTAGGASLVVLCPFNGQVDRLWARARALGHAAGCRIPWQGETVRVHPLIGLHVPFPGEQAAEVIAQAEHGARRIV